MWEHPENWKFMKHEETTVWYDPTVAIAIVTMPYMRFILEETVHDCPTFIGT